MTSTTKIERAVRAVATIALGISVLGTMASIQLAGGSILDFLLYLLLAIFLVVMPGAAITHWLLPEIKGEGKIACAFAMGLGTLLFSSLVASALNTVKSMFILPMVLAIWESCHIFSKRRKKCNAKAEGVEALSSNKACVASTHLAHSILLFCVAGGLFVYCFSGILAFAHASKVGNMVYHQDMMWSVGNGAAVQFGLPLQDIRAEGGNLFYHYLSDALPGFLALAGNLLPYDAACYYNYPLILIMLVVSAYSAAHMYGAKPVMAALLPMALIFSQGFYSPNTLELLRNMNGVPAATALACTLMYLVFYSQRPETSVLDKREKVRFFAAFAIVCLVLLLSKNLYAILIICAVLAAAIVGSFVQKRWLKEELLLVAIGFFTVGVCWIFVFQHAINNMINEFWISPITLAKSLLIALPLGVVLWIVSIILSLKSFKALSFSRLVVNAAAIGGLLAYSSFKHYSASQIYFFLAAFLFMWFCALDVAPLIERKKSFRYIAMVLAIISVLGTVMTLLPVGQKGIQVALRSVGARPEYPAIEETVTKGDEEAARWLRENMSLQDVFATNRNAKNAEAGEGTWHYYTAMSGQQAYVESWRYAMDYGFEYHALRYQLEKVSDIIFQFETAQEAFTLAKKHNIRFLLVSLPLKPQPFTGADPVFENQSVRIYEVV